MTPDPNLRIMALILGLISVAVAVLGPTVVAAVSGLVTLLVWLALRFSYTRLRRSWSPGDAYRDLPDELAAVDGALTERSRLDGMLDRCTALVVLATASSCLVAGFSHSQVLANGLLEVVAAASALAIIGGIYWSSLVDWYWILPRVSGLGGDRPCRAGPEPDGQPQNWEEVTRWWLIHRTLAVVAVSGGLGGLVGTIAGLAAGVADSGAGLQAAIVAVSGLVAGGIQAYRERAIEGISLWLHPEIVLGEGYVDSEAGSCYPVDVAMEGFKVVSREAQHQRYLQYRTKGTSRFLRAKGDLTVRLADALPRRAGADAGVSCNECLGYNWYCLENPRAWSKGEHRPADAEEPGLE